MSTFVQSEFIKATSIVPTHSGILDNLSFAVKDVIDIKGQKTSCGNPTWLNQQKPSEDHAISVTQLLANGAACLGKTVLGEFCSGSMGINHFYGMPKNYNAPNRVPGGSSSGSASVVSGGIVDFSLGTDAAGSVRIPASFSGVYGMRPSYGMISMSGVKSFSPSFDTIGIFSKKIDILELVFNILHLRSLEVIDTAGYFFVLQDYLNFIKPSQKKIIQRFIDNTCESLQLKPIYIQLSDVHQDADNEQIGMSATFKTILCAEIWSIMQPIIDKYTLVFSENTFVDFSPMKHINKKCLLQALERKAFYSKAMDSLLKQGSLLCIPSAPDIAPKRKENYSQVNAFDYNKLRPFVALSSLCKLPQINIPLKDSDNLPLGVSLLSGFNQDQFLIKIVKKIVLL